MRTDTTVTLTISTKTTATASGLARSAAAASVSRKVVMLAPMMYGIAFSWRTNPRAERGTRRLRERETERVSDVTARPRRNVTIGLYSRRFTRPSCVDSRRRLGRARSKSEKLASIKSKQMGKSIHGDRFAFNSRIRGANIQSTGESIIESEVGDQRSIQRLASITKPSAMLGA